MDPQKIKTVQNSFASYVPKNIKHFMSCIQQGVKVKTVTTK